MKTVLKDDVMEPWDNDGSLYMLIDKATREMLCQNNLGEARFDPQRHAVRRRVGLNKEGKVYCEIWFVRKPKE